jgi:hypothetical protein
MWLYTDTVWYVQDPEGSHVDRESKTRRVWAGGSFRLFGLIRAGGKDCRGGR